MVDNGDFLNATHCAGGSTGFLREVFALHVGWTVFFQWNARISPLLGAVVHQAVLADVQVSGAGSAPPIVGLSSRQIFLKPVDS
jgi:hypothetical protein